VGGTTCTGRPSRLAIGAKVVRIVGAYLKRDDGPQMLSDYDLEWNAFLHSHDKCSCMGMQLVMTNFCCLSKDERILPPSDGRHLQHVVKREDLRD